MSEQINNKRKRDPAFQPCEKELLLDLVEKHFPIIECKKTDAQSVKTRTVEWQKISDEFNALCPIMHRNWQVLKNLWENLKRKANAVITLQNQNYYGTAGREENKIKDEPIIGRIICLIRPSVEGFRHQWDSDNLETILSAVPGQSSEENHAVIVSAIQETNETEENESQSLINGDWSHYTPTQFRAPKASVLRDLGGSSVDFIEVKVPSASASKQTSAQSVELHKELLEVSKEEVPFLGEGSASISRTPKQGASRRRPASRKSEAILLAEAKIKTLETTNEFSAEEHQLRMQILRLQHKQEKERLKQEIEKTMQEKIKTKILERQLEKLN